MMIRRADDVVFRELAAEGGGVLLRLDDGQYHGLNAMGCVIWELVGEGIAMDQLINEVRSAVDPAPDQLAAEVEAFVAALVERRLLIDESQE